MGVNLHQNTIDVSFNQAATHPPSVMGHARSTLVPHVPQHVVRLLVLDPLSPVRCIHQPGRNYKAPSVSSAAVKCYTTNRVTMQ